ncbi:MAG: response regulator [Anaerolineales bacterium]
MPRILIIEDNDTTRQEIAEGLTMEGFDVLSASTGPEGRDLAIQERPELIICDIMLPGLDGYGVVESLRELPELALTPIVFLTAKTDAKAQRYAMRIGADDFLVKPVEPKDLLDVVYTRLARIEIIKTSQSSEMGAARTAFLRMVAHELRTPLITISMIQEIFNRQLGNLSQEQMQDFLDSLGAGTRRMQHLVEQTIYLVQLESGALSLAEIQGQGIRTQTWFLLKAAVDLARKFSYRSKDHAEVQLAEHVTDAEIICMPDALKHAFAELITNAMNFTPSDGLIQVSQWQTRNHLWVNVLDNGKGMSEEDIQRSQQPFLQIDRDKTEQQGSGLGIPVAHNIIAAHGGRLEIRSVVDKGTQVQIMLPLGL